jgi:hypothetical protein
MLSFWLTSAAQSLARAEAEDCLARLQTYREQIESQHKKGSIRSYAAGAVGALAGGVATVAIVNATTPLNTPAGRGEKRGWSYVFLVPIGSAIGWMAGREGGSGKQEKAAAELKRITAMEDQIKNAYENRRLGFPMIRLKREIEETLRVKLGDEKDLVGTISQLAEAVRASNETLAFCSKAPIRTIDFYEAVYARMNRD